MLAAILLIRIALNNVYNAEPLAALDKNILVSEIDCVVYLSDVLMVAVLSEEVIVLTFRSLDASLQEVVDMAVASAYFHHR